MMNQQVLSRSGSGMSINILDLGSLRGALEVCPSCSMPFDKGKKRKLIDACGHERCYACLFRSEACPLCTAMSNTDDLPAKKSVGVDEIQPVYSETKDSRYSARSKLRTATTGHFTSYMQDRIASRSPSPSPSPAMSPVASPSPVRLPRTRPRVDPMTKSCPTPPQSRRRFFLRSPWIMRHRASDSQASQNGLSDEENVVNSKPITNAGVRCKSSQNDLYMRLGLLLGSEASSAPARRSPSPVRMRTSITSTTAQVHQQSPEPEHHRPASGASSGASSKRGGGKRSLQESCASFSSLGSLETPVLGSSNTSPVSTLTGSSEADRDVHHIRSLKEPSSDSITSLMSISAQSNNSSSPVSRRHSVTTAQVGNIEDLAIFKERRSVARRSARSGTIKGPIDPKIRFAAYRPQPQLLLRPLFFEVPLQESEPLFIGRHWLIRELEEAMESPGQGLVIAGNPGTGKTALVLQLVDYSCFGRRHDPFYQDQDNLTHDSSEGIYSHPHLVWDRSERVTERLSLRHLAAHVVAYHFCQADNQSTCLVPDFIQSLAAQLCQAPQLAAYSEHLQSEPHLQNAITMRECIADPDLALNRGILEPLSFLRRVGKIPSGNCLVLIDALCEAEYHRTDNGLSIGSFLAKHISQFPAWLKVVVTVRTQLQEVVAGLSFQSISLDKLNNNENLQKDLLEYVTYRVTNSIGIQSNIGGATSGSGTPSSKTEQNRFCQHVANLARGSFIFAKLTLDLLEKGHLVVKSSSYKVLPVSLAQIFLLHFNLRFPTVRSFEKMQPILSVCLAALYPLTLLEIFYSINALLTDSYLEWEEFLQRFSLLTNCGLLVKRRDNTYMFFHPSFREWLIRRDEGESNKFVCDLRTGHAGIAFRLSRIQTPLDEERTLELGHHILKAHLYKNMTLHRYSSGELQAHWVSSSSGDVSSALCSLRNIYNPNVKVSRLLLLAGADPNTITEFLGQAPALCMFAHEGATDMVSLLLEFGADVELTNNQGCTALALAAMRGHAELVHQLVSAGARLGHADMAGQCALVHAARGGYLTVAGYLLSCDWVVTNSNDVGLTEAVQQALVAAAAQNYGHVVEYLLDMSEVRADDSDTLTGETALTAAATNGCQNVICILLQRGASISQTNRKELSPLLLAVKEGHWASCELLLQHHAPLEQVDASGRSALMLAAAEGHVGLIELLLDKGACNSSQDRDGLTALSWACARGRLQAAQCLLDRGASVSHADKTGRTPLDLAAFQGNPALVTMLLERGALIEHVDIHGMRPLDRAIGCRNVQVVQCFLRKGAKLGPATWAMAAGKPEIMLALLNKLLEDGNVLYRKSRLEEASHRYAYALKKFPTEAELGESGESIATFQQLRINFLLNQSRCKRKLNKPEESIELATEVLKLKQGSYEAMYARAKAKLDMKLLNAALEDAKSALRVAPHTNREVRRVLLRLEEDIRHGLQSSSNSSMRCGSYLGASVDTLVDPETRL